MAFKRLYNVIVNVSEEIGAIRQQLDELMEAFRQLSEKHNTQYTDIMLLLKNIEEKLQASEIEIRTDDELYEDAKEAVIEVQLASTSYLQRILGIGYARAARLMDMLEEQGVIGEPDGAKPRAVLLENDEEGRISSWMDGDDEKYEEARVAVLEAGKVSVPFLQRKFDIGYARSARLIDKLQENGVVEMGDYTKPRKVIAQE